MSETILLGPPPATLAILLDDPDAHDFPAVERILRGLTPEQATTIPHGFLSYSIARIVAHMHSNMKFNLGLIGAQDPSAYDERFENWPQVPVDGWPALLDQFFTHLHALTQVARESRELDRVLYPATDKEPSWTVGYKLACSVAKHNAYHLGQIVVLRRLIGAWQERAPSDT